MACLRGDTWSQMGARCAFLQHIYSAFPSHPTPSDSVHTPHRSSPVVQRPCQQADFSGTMMSTVCPTIALIVSSPQRWLAVSPSLYLFLSLALSASLCLSYLPGHEVTLAGNTADVDYFSTQEMPASGSPCTFLYEDQLPEH